MLVSAKDYEDFYLSRSGRLVRDVLRQKIRKIWPSVKGARMLGYGYAYPYLDLYYPETELCFGASRLEMGAQTWPQKEQSAVCIAGSSSWPFESAFYDHVIMVHAIEHASSIRGLLREAWRVLRGNGRMILIIPNRLGFWSRAQWSPFGVGTPYSRAQIEEFLTQEMFDIDRVVTALHSFPSTNNFAIKMGPSLEKIGPYLMPAFGGVHIIECSKKLYASAKPQGGSNVHAKAGRWVFIPENKPVS